MKLRKRKLQTGKQVYYLNFKIDGRRYNISTKTHLKVEAQKFAKRYMTEFNSKREIGLTLQEFKDEYLKRIDASHSYSSWRNIKSCFKVLIDRFGQNMPIQNIDFNIAESFILGKFKQKKYAASLYHRTFKAAWNRAMDWGFIDFNPWSKIKLPKIPEKLPAYLDEEEFETLLKFQKDEKLRAIYIIAFKTGFRLGEILSLEWADVNFTTKEIKLSIKTTFVPKGKKERVIPMGELVYSTLDNLYKQQADKTGKVEGFLFIKPNGTLYLKNHVSKSFKRMVKKSGLNKDLHFHSLRHSFCSNLINKGASIYVIKELAGHSSVGVTQKYSHVNKDNLKSTIALLD